MQSRVEASRSWPGVLVVTPMVTLAVLLATMAAILPASPQGAYAHHDGMLLICPNPIPEGHYSWMGVGASGRKVLQLAAYTYHDSFTASAHDYVEYDGFLIENDTEDNTLWIPVVTTQDMEPERDETFSIGYWDDGIWHGCVVTIEDDDLPEVTHLSITSRPGDGFVYRAGENIDIRVDFSAPVEVEGVPHLSLYVDGEGDSDWRGARYASGSGGRRLIFRYQVQSGDLDLDGFTVGSAGVADDGSPAYGFGGRINARGTDVHVDYTHSGLAGATAWIDGRPYVQRVWVSSSPPGNQHAYRANQIIEVSMGFNMEVEVEGVAFMDLHVGAERQATYLAVRAPTRSCSATPSSRATWT